jgi:hypothetical protein
MLSEYETIYCSRKDAKSKLLAIECIGVIQSYDAAAFLGSISLNNDNENAVFKLIKKMPDDLKLTALFSGLKVDVTNQNEALQDSLAIAFYQLGEPALRKIIESDYLSVGFQKVLLLFCQDKTLSTNRRIEAIVVGLKKSEDEVIRSKLIEEIRKLGQEAMIALIKDWNYSRNKNILHAIVSLGNNAINYLGNQLGDNADAEELLAQIGKPAVATLKSKMKNSKQTVRFAAADALVKMTKYNPSAIKDLIDNSNLNIIAQNYPFYIRLGQQGTEDLLLKTLSKYFSKNMCLDYLNCGNSRIGNGATEIARRHGYDVYSSVGSNYGPKWGQGN